MVRCSTTSLRNLPGMLHPRLAEWGFVICGAVRCLPASEGPGIYIPESAEWGFIICGTVRCLPASEGPVIYIPESAEWGFVTCGAVRCFVASEGPENFLTSTFSCHSERLRFSSGRFQTFLPDARKARFPSFVRQGHSASHGPDGLPQK